MCILSVSIYAMIKEPPQFKLRLSSELKDKIQASAKENGRSYNAEICHRLERSFLYETPRDELIHASRATEQIRRGRQLLPARIRKKIFRDISDAVDILKTFVYVDLSDLGLNTFTEDELDELTAPITQELVEAGYKVKWDGGSSIWISIPEGLDTD